MEVTFKTTHFEQQMMGYAKKLTRTDVLQGYINILETKEHEKDRDGARNTLDMIRKLLDEPDNFNSPIVIEEEDCRTLLAVHKMIRANSIRLRYKCMDISGYFKLLQNVKERLFNKNSNTYTKRLTVAEEMSKLNLFPQMITEQWQLREDRAPNRAFMDILHKIRPDFASDDLLRREYTKLGFAWEKKDEKSLNEIREKIKELGGKDYTKELKVN